MDRLALVTKAAVDEQIRFNQACKQGAKPIIHAFDGDYVVYMVTPEWWYVCHAIGNKPDWFTDHHYCGCNDGTWADLLKQAGVSRNKLWERASGQRKLGS